MGCIQSLCSCPRRYCCCCCAGGDDVQTQEGLELADRAGTAEQNQAEKTDFDKFNEELDAQGKLSYICRESKLLIDVMVLDMLIKDLSDHVQMMSRERTTPKVMIRLLTISEEIRECARKISDPKFKLYEFFNKELASVGDLQPLPDLKHLGNFMQALKIVFDPRVRFDDFEDKQSLQKLNLKALDPEVHHWSHKHDAYGHGDPYAVEVESVPGGNKPSKEKHRRNGKRMSTESMEDESCDESDEEDLSGDEEGDEEPEDIYRHRVTIYLEDSEEDLLRKLRRKKRMTTLGDFGRQWMPSDGHDPCAAFRKDDDDGDNDEVKGIKFGVNVLRGVILTRLRNAMSVFCRRFPICRWFVDVLHQEVQEYHNYIFASSGFWPDGEYFHSKKCENLEAWCYLGNLLQETIDRGKIREKSLYRSESLKVQRAIQTIHSATLPSFILKLSYAQSIMKRQLQQIDNLRTKTLGGLVTLAVTGGTQIKGWLQEQDLHELAQKLRHWKEPHASTWAFSQNSTDLRSLII
eukprot:TRINITY_DN66737_c0_g1_i1.p1 TRINITY_DN66737_c0_g1~~TRINITY_DN66737_c0_g1_i1.p1  ORF type:complete len:520 (-),score=83.86 TRINITY_DN66737_c0_g1_i1:88-1647(-)